MLNLLRKTLMHEGFIVEAAPGGCEALARLEAGTPCDILISDIQMPGTDGEKLLERALELRPGIKVILITGYGSVEQHSAMMKKGAAGYVTKPFKIPDLLEAIERTMPSTS